MVIIETPIFTKQITGLIPDDSYSKLQNVIRTDPESGDIIPGSNGLRKIRWAVEERGKRGGIRVIYYWVTPEDQIYMLLAYPKNQQENLTTDQLKILKQLVEVEFK